MEYFNIILARVYAGARARVRGCACGCVRVRGIRI